MAKTSTDNRVDVAVIFFVVTSVVAYKCACVCVGILRLVSVTSSSLELCPASVCVRRRRASSHPSNDSSIVVLTVRIPTSFLPVIVRQNLMTMPLPKKYCQYTTVVHSLGPRVNQADALLPQEIESISATFNRVCDESHRCFAPPRQRVRPRPCHTWQPRRESQNSMSLTILYPPSAHNHQDSWDSSARAVKVKAPSPWSMGCGICAHGARGSADAGTSLGMIRVMPACTN